MRGRGTGRQLMAALEAAALESRRHPVVADDTCGTDACAFYEAIGYTKLGMMPEYSRRPDGTLWPGAFYFKELSA